MKIECVVSCFILSCFSTVFKTLNAKVTADSDGNSFFGFICGFRGVIKLIKCDEFYRTCSRLVSVVLVVLKLVKF